jgi:carbonic anhydrase
MQTSTEATRTPLSPDDVLELLREGNARFRGGKRADRNLLEQVRDTSGGQWPMAAVLGCIDSRVSPEVVFDQGVGDIFSARIAGNFLNDDLLGSLEFACHVAGAKLIVVLGHSHCGAVKGACDRVELGHLTQTLSNILPSVDAVSTPSDPAERTSSNPAFVDSVARENVRRTVAKLTERSDVLRAMVDAGTLRVVGAMYDVESGDVELM